MQSDLNRLWEAGQQVRDVRSTPRKRGEGVRVVWRVRWITVFIESRIARLLAVGIGARIILIARGEEGENRMRVQASIVYAKPELVGRPSERNIVGELKIGISEVQRLVSRPTGFVAGPKIDIREPRSLGDAGKVDIAYVVLIS